MKQTYLKTDSFYKLPYRPYCLIGPKNGRGRSCFFLICSVEGCTPITMPKLARETALIDLAAQCKPLKMDPEYQLSGRGRGGSTRSSYFSFEVPG